MARNCRKCGDHIPNWVKIEGINRNLCNRKFCLKCSPYNLHNTKTDIDKISRNNTPYSEWSKEEKKKNINSTQKRGLERKIKLIEMAGNKCKLCDYHYNGSERALSFHHKDPSKKLFGLTQNNLWSKTWDVILEEFEKCELLCLVCHAELEDKIFRNSRINEKEKDEPKL